jgi:glycosyltransferase involved in cell wall biosynthesis
VFPSLFEGWGIAVAEALACGIPVVAYDIPALREVFGPCKSVFLTPARNVAQMALTVTGMLDSENKELAENSANYAKNFSWKKVSAADLEAIFKAASKSL